MPSCLQFLAPGSQSHGLRHLPCPPSSYPRKDPLYWQVKWRRHTGEVAMWQSVERGCSDSTLERWCILSLARQRRTVPGLVFCWALMWNWFQSDRIFAHINSEKRWRACVQTNPIGRTCSAAERKPLAIHHTLKDEQGGPAFPFKGRKA